jgi:hypothetical protein
MKINPLAIIFCLFLSIPSFSQVGISATNTPPNTSAMLDVSSTTKGLLMPRMTITQRLAITSPAVGLTVYDTDYSGYWMYNGSSWKPLSPWLTSGNNIYNDNSGNVGIGISVPSFGLDVRKSNGTLFTTQVGSTANNTVRILKNISPGNFISSTAALYVESGQNFDGIEAVADNRDAIKGYSQSGNGVYGYSQSGYGVYGYTNGTSITLGLGGVVGFSPLSSNGVYGESGSGNGVWGFSQSGIGIRASSINNYALYALKDGVQTGITALFENTNTSNLFPLVSLRQSASSATALKIATSTSNGIDLENSSIKVTGINKMAFQVVGTGIASITIPNTGFANNINDIIVVTHKRASTTILSPVYVDFDGFNWKIFTENGSNIPFGEVFNVLVFKQQ